MIFLFYILLILGPLLGGLIAIFSSVRSNTSIKVFLSFAAGYLFSITVLNLMPHAYENHNEFIGIFVLAGFIFQIILEQFSGGVEHGHIHNHMHSSKKLIPFSLMISMGLHSFMEGIPLGGLLYSGTQVQFSLVLGIMLHEFPAAFSLMSIMRASKIGTIKLIFLLVGYSILAPSGAMLSQLLSVSIPQEVFSYFMAFVIGTFLHISTTILFESSENHKFKQSKLYAILAGVMVAVLVTLI